LGGLALRHGEDREPRQDHEQAQENGYGQRSSLPSIHSDPLAVPHRLPTTEPHLTPHLDMDDDDDERDPFLKRR
jgi:hypothetical protein